MTVRVYGCEREGESLGGNEGAGMVFASDSTETKSGFKVCAEAGSVCVNVRTYSFVNCINSALVHFTAPNCLRTHALTDSQSSRAFSPDLV